MGFLQDQFAGFQGAPQGGLGGKELGGGGAQTMPQQLGSKSGDYGVAGPTPLPPGQQVPGSAPPGQQQGQAAGGAPPIFAPYQNPDEMAQARSSARALTRGTPQRQDALQEFRGRRRETRAGTPFQNPERERIRNMAPGQEKRTQRRQFRNERRAGRGIPPIGSRR